MHAAAAALSLLILAACGPAATGSGGPADPDVDAIFADLRGDRPGAAVGVVWNGEVVHRAGYGTAHLDHGVPITPETVFDIASISKQFGAMAALLLESEGGLDLDADVRDTVSELPDFGAVITARHLIHHTSGIRDWPHTMALGGIGFTDVISFEKILRMLYQQQAINFPPGSEYAYSNTGYNLLARVIEVQSGMTFREYTGSRIFAPLGMTRTHFSDDYLEVVPGRAESYAPIADGEGFQRMPNQLTALASSSLHTTMDDFIRWMRNYETGQVGSAEMLGTMVQRGVLTNGETLDYAHGLSVADYRGLPTFGHGGSWVGYRTNFVRFPEQNLSIAVFCNVADCNPAARARRVAEVFIGDLMGPTPEASTPDPNPEGPELTAAQLQQYAGSYRSPELDSTFDLEVDADGRLVATHWRNDPSILSPTDTDTFRGDQWFLPRSPFRPRRRRPDHRLHRNRHESARPDLRTPGLNGAAAWSAGFSRHSGPQARRARRAHSPDGASAWNAGLRPAQRRSAPRTAQTPPVLTPRTAGTADVQAGTTRQVRVSLIRAVADPAWNAGFSRHSPPQAGGSCDSRRASCRARAASRNPRIGFEACRPHRPESPNRGTSRSSTTEPGPRREPAFEERGEAPPRSPRPRAAPTDPERPSGTHPAPTRCVQRGDSRADPHH